MVEELQTVRAFCRRYYHSFCWYCGRKLVKRHLRKGWKKFGNFEDTATYDHTKPRSKGGTGKHKVPCCMECNVQKMNLEAEEFRLVFFGGHGGQFWGEQYAIAIKQAQFSMITAKFPEVIPCATLKEL